MKQKEITLDELYNRGLLPIKAINICRNAGLNTMSQILEFYERNGSFLGLEDSNKLLALHLIKFCKKYRDFPLDFYDEKKTIKESTNKNQSLQKIVIDFEPIKLNVLDRQIEFLLSKLKPRISKYLVRLFGENSTSDFIENLNSDSFDILELTLGNNKLAETFSNFKTELSNVIIKLDKFETKLLDNTIEAREQVVFFEKFRKLRTPKVKLGKSTKAKKKPAKRKAGRPRKEKPAEGLKRKVGRPSTKQIEETVTPKRRVGRPTGKIIEDSSTEKRKPGRPPVKEEKSSKELGNKAGRPKSNVVAEKLSDKGKVSNPDSMKDTPLNIPKRNVGRPKTKVEPINLNSKTKVRRPSSKLKSEIANTLIKSPKVDSVIKSGSGSIKKKATKQSIKSKPVIKASSKTGSRAPKSKNL